MAEINVHAETPYGFASHPPKSTVQSLAGGSISEMAGGGAAIILAIVALTGVMPVTLTAVGIIALGVALFLEGIAVAAGYRQLVAIHDTTGEEIELGGGLTAESLGGLAAIALGILALLGVDPTSLLAISAIVLGAAVMFGAGVTARLNDLRVARQADPSTQRVAREAVYAASGTQLLVGIAAIVLGIVALQSATALMLVAIATLCMGFSVEFAGSAIGSKLASHLHG